MSEIERRPSTPPGWYHDPAGLQRWWDGTAWGVYAPVPAPAPGPMQVPMAVPMQVPMAVPVAVLRPMKETSVAYLFAIFLGGLGIHHFYLGNTGKAVTMLILYLLGWLTAWLFIGFFLWAVVGIWLIVDLFLIPGYVRAANSRVVAIYR